MRRCSENTRGVFAVEWSGVEWCGVVFGGVVEWCYKWHVGVRACVRACARLADANFNR